MAIRTKPKDVQDILGRNYGEGTNLSPYIEAASSIVDRLVVAAAALGVATRAVSASQAELVERWLAAHYYTQMDPLYKRRQTADGSGDFVEHGYLEAAKQIDPSGLLDGILSRRVMTAYCPRVKPCDREAVAAG